MTTPDPLPATWVVTVGDDPTERLGTWRTGLWDVLVFGSWWLYEPGQVCVVRFLIPAGTPVNRLMVMPEGQVAAALAPLENK